MTIKPKCACWDDPARRGANELRIDCLGAAIQNVVDDACRQMTLCGETSDYVAASVLAGLVVWAAYYRSGVDEVPTKEKQDEALASIIELTRERLAGARQQDLDQIAAASNL